MENTMIIAQEFSSFLNHKLEKNSQGGRPSFLQQLSETSNVQYEALNILELAWLKNRSIGSIARKYKTTYSTIYRLLRDLEPFKQDLTRYMQLVPRRKVFYNRDSGSSDYDTVQAYIRRARRVGLKNYKARLRRAQKCWRFLKYKDPSNWTADHILEFLNTLTKGSQSAFLDAIRKVAPQIADQHSADYVGTGRYREKLSRRKKDLFGSEVKMIIKALESSGLAFHEVIFKLHVTLAAREGSRDSESGITGLSWDRFKNNFSRVDVYESKVRGGIWWRDCPLTLFFDDLPIRLKRLWIERGQPTTDKILLNGYPELLQIYKEISQLLVNTYKKQVDPNLLDEFSSLKPHDADKIHVNLLWEAGVPLEVVAGQYLGRGEGIGLMGRGWLDINTIKKHYLSLTQRSERFQKLRTQVKVYSLRFNGHFRSSKVEKEQKAIAAAIY